MKKFLFVVLCVVYVPYLILAQDIDSIFVWDNDRGRSAQSNPAVGFYDNAHGFAAWDDARWGDRDVYGQEYEIERDLVGPNFPVSIDQYNRFEQFHTDITCNPKNLFICTWEESLYNAGEKPSKVYALIDGKEPYLVFEHEQSQKFPSISSRIEGWYALSWTSYQGPPEPPILCKIYDDQGEEQKMNVVCEGVRITTYVPRSNVAYCDTGGLVVYEDWMNDGTEISVYGQYFDRDGGIIEERYKISHYTGGSEKDEKTPDVATNEYGEIVVVWVDNYSGVNRIWAQRMKAHYDKCDFVGSPFQVYAGSGPQQNPRVAVFSNGDFIIVWEELQSGDWDVWGRAWVSAEPRTPFRIPVNNTSRQQDAYAAARWSNMLGVVWASWAYNNQYPDVFLRNFKTDNAQGTGMVPLTGDIPLVPINPDTGVGGRKCWYHDDENYDNPDTPDWDEDPIPEPDSVYVDLEYAIVDQLMELNTNGQYMVFCEETLPCQELPFRAGAGDYDAIFIDCGYRTPGASAGVITPAEQSEICAFLAGKEPVMVEGNDFGRDYHGTYMFDSLFGAEYLGDGASYKDGNIDTLYGVSGTSFADESLQYNYQALVDNYVDSIRPKGDYELILESSGAPGDWLAGRCVGWGAYWDEYRRFESDSFTVYCSFMLSGIKSTTHPHTYAEFYRRLLGYLGLNCQPAPIVDITADATGASEGRVYLDWLVVSDDAPDESAEGDYKLKFSRAKMTSETAFNNAEEYYQTWYTGDKQVGDPISEYLYGLPPAETLVFALKVSDEMALWGALGAEPRATIGGDTLTPHALTVGSNYVKDFQNGYEFLHRREQTPGSGNYDSLFVTWSATNFYVGFARCDLTNGGGDLFVYVDTRPTDGAGTTINYTGTGSVSYFVPSTGEFKPDYAFVVEDDATISAWEYDNTEGGRAGWVTMSFTGSFCEDDVVNNYEYTEIRIPFSNMGYTSTDPFKLVVLVGRETTNLIQNAYPIFNPIGAYGVNITQYYYWTHLGDSLVPNKSVQVIGIEEEEVMLGVDLQKIPLAIFPNPFNHDVTMYYALSGQKTQARIMIYDVTGRLIRTYDNLDQLPDHHLVWNGTDEQGHKVAQGVYFCEYTSGEITTIKKMVYVK